jgi:hypothetical protein
MKQNVVVVLLSLLIVFLFIYSFYLPMQENYKDIKTVFAASMSGINTANDNGLRYSSDNYNVEYHDAISDIAGQDGDSGIAWVADACGNKIGLPQLKGQEYITYYNPGSYKYGASNYVPTYEDSIYLSKQYRNPSHTDEKNRNQ